MGVVWRFYFSILFSNFIDTSTSGYVLLTPLSASVLLTLLDTGYLSQLMRFVSGVFLCVAYIWQIRCRGPPFINLIKKIQIDRRKENGRTPKEKKA